MKKLLLIQLLFLFLIFSSCSARINSSAVIKNTTAEESQNIELVRTYWQEVWNNGNLQGVEDFYHPQAIHGKNFTIAGFQKVVASQRAVFPDFKVIINDIFTSGNRVICRVTYTGTHSGKKMLGQEPLDKAIEVPGMDIFTIKDGKCVEHQHVADHLDLVLQMGIKLAPVKDPEVIKLEIVQASDEYIQLIKLLHGGTATAVSDLKEISKKLATEYECTDGAGETFTKEEDLEYYKNTEIKLSSAEVTDRKVKVIDTNTAVETGILSFNGTKNEKSFSYKKKYTTTWTWRDGRWQIIADHASKTI